MRRTAIAALLLGLTAQAPAAQPAAPAPAPSPRTPAAAAALDPARLAAAERLVGLMMPPDLLRRMLSQGLPGMDAMMEITPAEIGMGNTMGLDAEDQERSLGDLMNREDPHARERLVIRNRVTGEVMREVFVQAEPEIRRAIAEMFARRFTVPEMTDMSTFFASPPGRKYAELALTMGEDPDFIRAMASLVPRFMEAAMSLEERVAAASAHLPPPPGPAEMIDTNMADENVNAQ